MKCASIFVWFITDLHGPISLIESTNACSVYCLVVLSYLKTIPEILTKLSLSLCHHNNLQSIQILRILWYDVTPFTAFFSMSSTSFDSTAGFAQRCILPLPICLIYHTKMSFSVLCLEMQFVWWTIYLFSSHSQRLTCPKISALDHLTMHFSSSA